MVRDEAMRPRDLPQAALDETAAGVAPGDDLDGAEALLRRRTSGQLRAERRAELVRVEVDDGQLTQVARREHAPVAAAAGDRQLPELAEAIRLLRNVPEAVRDAR